MALINQVDLDAGTITYQPIPFPIPEPQRSLLISAGKTRNTIIIDEVERSIREKQPVITRKLFSRHGAMTTNEICTQLSILADLCYNAQLDCDRGDFKRATDVLQSQVTPLLQIVAHEMWLRHHTSGLPPA